MADITIPDGAVEAAATDIFRVGFERAPVLPDDDDRMAFARRYALAALRAGLAAWPGMVHMPALKFNGLPPHMHRPEHIILPLTQEKTDG